MSLVECFPPVSRPDAQVLILGSMPGVRSLQQSEYYAHPRNAFWPIMAHIFDFPENLPYPQRLEKLMEQRLALWDVMASCRRSGSLDSAIVESSVQANDFVPFLAKLTMLETILFNGSAAEKAFRHHVLPTLSNLAPNFRLQRLPSTSPAHAGTSYAEKLAAWSIVKHLQQSD